MLKGGPSGVVNVDRLKSRRKKKRVELKKKKINLLPSGTHIESDSGQEEGVRRAEKIHQTTLLTPSSAPKKD